MFSNSLTRNVVHWAAVFMCQAAFVTELPADIFIYKTESEYVSALNALGVNQVSEGFESSAWNDARSPSPFDHNIVASKLNGSLLWEPAAKDVWGSQFSNRQHGLTTNHNWARTGQWGLYEDHLGEGYPTTIRISSASTIYGVGGWFDTNPDGQSVGFLFPDRTQAQPPGYYLQGVGVMYPGDNPAFGHAFSGIIDTDGFQSVILSGTLELDQQGQLQGGNIFGADDFLVGLSQAVPEPLGIPVVASVAFVIGFRRRSGV